MSEDPVSAWKRVTHVDSDEVARHFLDMASGNVNHAVALYFENSQAEGQPGSSQSSGESAFSASSMRHRSSASAMGSSAGAPRSDRVAPVPVAAAEVNRLRRQLAPGHRRVAVAGGAAGRDDAAAQRRIRMQQMGGLLGSAWLIWHSLTRFCGKLWPFFSTLFHTLFVSPLSVMAEALGFSTPPNRRLGVSNSRQAYTRYLDECAISTRMSRFCRQSLFSVEPSFRTVMDRIRQDRRCCVILFYNHTEQRCEQLMRALFSSDQNEVIDYLTNHQSVVWFADLRHREALQLYRQISASLNGATSRTPLLCVCAVHPTNQRLLLLHRQSMADDNLYRDFDRMQQAGDQADDQQRLLVNEGRPGGMARLAVLQAIDTGTEKFDRFENERLAEERSLEYSRSLRQIQEQEWQREVREEEERRREQEREQKEREESEERRKEEQQREEQARKREEDRKQRIRSEAQARLKPEPKRGENNTCLVRIRLPDGSTISRRFKLEYELKQLFYFVESHSVINSEGSELESGHWSLLQTLPPRKVFEDSEDGSVDQSLLSHGFDKHGASLFVQETLD